ncbi:MAG: hypothetical protein KDA80_02845 [Planctomycetaceae bacterium]|nr:hypothetical protein [Planctomycetaceae bacterium]
MSLNDSPRDDLNRRQFNRLSMAAFGGVVAGSLTGCPDSANPTNEGSPSGAPEPPAEAPGDSGEDTAEVSLLLQEPHVCRGLNMCKEQGSTKDNACAGQGNCASVASHVCGGQNECKGQGGCGSKPGENSCKGEGHCAVPLQDHAWGTARKNFEAAMQSAGKEFGDAPEKG